jgi:hypothetical protein
MNLWALKEEMGYDARVKERVDVNKVKRLCKNPDAINNLKNFIELPNTDADVVVSKRVMKVMRNEADEEEKEIIVKVIDEEKKEEENKYDVRRIVDFDDSIESAIEADETEAEGVEDGWILMSDGEEEAIREYVTNLCVPHSQESGVMTGEEKEKSLFQQTRSLRTKSLALNQRIRLTERSLVEGQ